MTKSGVNCAKILTKENISTGVAPITVATSSGENRIVVIPGANLKLTPEDLEKNRELVQNAKIIVCQNEISDKTTKKVEIIPVCPFNFFLKFAGFGWLFIFS